MTDIHPIDEEKDDQDGILILIFLILQMMSVNKIRMEQMMVEVFLY
jgi:hypothetical protein